MKLIETKTPFTIVENDEKTEYKIVIGNSLASNKTFKTKIDAIKYINKKPYELIGTLIVTINNKLYMTNNQQTKTNDNE